MLALYILLIFMVGTAILAIELEDLFSSVVALFSTGLALCIAYILLHAPDVAIMQLVCETLALVVLVKATMRADLTFSMSGRWYINTIIYVVFFVVLFITGMKCFPDLPPFGHPLMSAVPILMQGLPKGSEANLVSVVTLKYRVFDSLAEAGVLFVAVIGILTILRRKGIQKDK